MFGKPTKSLKIPKVQPEIINRRRTDDKEQDKGTDIDLQNITHKLKIELNRK